MSTTLTKTGVRRFPLLMALMLVGAVAFSLLPQQASAAAPTEYTLETSTGRTCRVEINAERTGGFLVLRRIEFETTFSCDSIAGAPAPSLAGGYLWLNSVEPLPTTVVVAAGERSVDHGYGCLETDTTPCRDAGQFALSLPGNYHAQSIFSLEVTGEGETWTTIPDTCLRIDDTHISCALTSATLSIDVLR